MVLFRYSKVIIRKPRQLLLLFGFFCLISPLHSEILIDGFAPSSGLEAWVVSGKGQVSLNDGKLTIIAENNDSNPKLTSRVGSKLAKAERISLVIRNASHAVAYNHAAGGLDISIGGTLSVRLTTWGDGSGIFIGNTLLPFESLPIASSNVSLEIIYDSAAKNIVVRQFGGSAKTGKQWQRATPAAPILLLEKTLDEPLDFSDKASVEILVRSQYNGGTIAKGTTIDGLRIEAN